MIGTGRSRVAPFRHWAERHPLVLPGLLLLVGALFRFYNLDWDSGHQLHPDERWIYELVSGANNNPPLGLPRSFSQFLSVQDPTGGSPMNPHFFAYGTLPFYLLAAIATALTFIGNHVPWLSDLSTMSQYGSLPYVGRPLSALLDLFSVALIFVLGRSIFGYWTAVLATALCSFTVLDIQLSHFYAVDTVLLPLCLLTLIATVRIIRKPTVSSYLLAGLPLGAALATKTTALLLVVPVGTAAVLAAWGSVPYDRRGALPTAFMRHYWAVARDINRNLQWLLWTLLLSAVTFAVLEPYAILDRTQLLHDIGEQTTFLVTNNPPFAVPFTIQYAGTTPYVFQFQNLVFWCLGIPLGLVAFAGVIVMAVRALRLRLSIEAIILLLWVVPYFLFVGRFFAKFNRYMLPITPVMTLLGAALLVGLAASLRSWVRQLGWAAIAVTVLVSFGYSAAYMNIYAHDNTRVAASTWIYTHIPDQTHIAIEGPWDDSLPLPQVGHDPAAEYPNPVSLDLYAGECDDTGLCRGADVQHKIDNIADALQHTKYIVMSSERLVRSIPKLANRYPVAIRYYDLLFSGRLNFKLVKVFQQHPQLGPIVVHDYSADESFHVYDHPIVRIFERTGPISAERVRSLLAPPGSRQLAALNPASTLPVNPPADHRLQLTGKQWAADQKGPAYDSMFPPLGFAMQHPILVWLLLLELLGLAAFPLVFFVFGGLSDRGFVLAKTMGLILVGWLVWITVSLGLGTYDRPLLYGALTLLILGGGVTAYALRDRLVSEVRAHWRAILTAEVIFLAAFAIMIGLRMWYPDLYHQYSPPGPTVPTDGRMGEKQMELAFLNATARSRVFPPYDPFFAHGYINYYYFGFYLVATMCKLAQISPAVGLNLAIATFFALLLGTTYSVVSTLTRRVTPGVLGALFVGLIGNLAAAWQLIGDLMSVATVHSSIPLIGGVLNVISGVRAVLIDHQTLPQIDFWGPTRIVPPVGASIAEFPYFTYLFADLHPHLMAYPMTAGAIALAVCLARKRYLWKEGVAAVALGGLLLGAIAATNPWDFPTYLGVAALGAAIGAYLVQRRFGARVILRPLIWLIGLGAVSSLAYLPFKQNYQTTFQTGLGLTREITPQLIGPDVSPSDAHDILVTPLHIYLEHFGLFMFVIVSYFLVLLWKEVGLGRFLHRWMTFSRFALYYRDRPRTVLRATRVAGRLRGPRLPILDPSFLAGGLILIAGLAFLQYYLLAWLGALLLLQGLVLQRLASRLRRWEVIACVFLLVPEALSIATQIFFVRDFLAGGMDFRMNTIFKFYNQAWVMYALCSATLLYALMDRIVPRVSVEPTPADAQPEPLQEPQTPAMAEPAAIGVRLAAPITVGAAPLVQAPAATVQMNGHSPDGSVPPEVPAAPEPQAPHRVLSWGLTITGRRVWRFAEQHTLWSIGFVALLAASFVYTIGGTENRETFRSSWLPESSVPWTLDGMAFMKVAYPQDYTGINWLNAHVTGAPVIAEARAPQYGYTWPSRVSMFTGLPTIINGIHEGEQRFDDQINPANGCQQTRDPVACTQRFPSRNDDINTLYDSPRPAEAWRVIHKYGVKYIFVGFSESNCIKDVCYSKAGLAKFDRMIGHGLRLAFKARGVKIYQVTA